MATVHPTPSFFRHDVGACVLTWFKRAPGHLGQESFKPLVLAVDLGGVCPIVVLLAPEQRQVASSGGNRDTMILGEYKTKE